MQKRDRDRIRRIVLRWYRREGRNLPWRNNRDPYRILVSEIMLQQTQVARVLEKYPTFLRQFPDLDRLACAQRRKVIIAWSGMGYNLRAVRLHEIAKRVVKAHRGKLADDFEFLIRLPGIGRYSANALLSFAYHRRVPVVDTNVRRVLSRILSPMKTKSDVLDDKRIWKEAERFLPPRKSRDWNHALMDLGAMICTARSPLCPRCPVRSLCRSAGRMVGPEPRVKRAEPSFGGIPNRIHRGRIVELLRGREAGREVTLRSLGRTLRKDFGPGHFEWLRALLEALEREGLLRIVQRSRTATIRVGLR